MRRVLAMVLCVLVLLPAALPAADESPEVRAALAPFRELMARLPPELAERLEEHARAWVGLTPLQRESFRERLDRWNDLPPQEKLAMRERYQAWSHMDETSRKAAMVMAERYAQWPEEVQQSWRERFEELDRATRQQYLYDPATRAAAELANKLFPFVPPSEELDTLAMLRDLNEAQVIVLRRKLSRLPPVQRDSYRQQLLEMGVEGRARELDGGG